MNILYSSCKRLFALIIIVVLCATYALPAFAQEGSVEKLVAAEVIEEETPTYKAIIQAKENVAVGKSIIFDASLSYIPEEVRPEYVTYTWNLGDGTQEEGVEVVHSYDVPGRYTVSLEIQTPTKSTEAQFSIFVFREMFLMLSDNIKAKEKILSLKSYAEEQGVFLKLIENFDDVSGFISEEKLAKKLIESLEDIKVVTRIIIWTRSSSGLTILSNFPKKLTSEVDFAKKEVIFISDSSLGALANVAYGVFQVLKLQHIIVTRNEALWPLIDMATTDEFLKVISERGITYKVITQETRPFTLTNFLSYLVNFAIAKGIPANSIMLILMLPVIVTIVSFMKQIVGVTTLGVYTPSLLALSFIALDLKFGLLILAIILVVGIGMRYFMRQYRLLYIPKMAMVMTMISLVFLLLLLLGAYFNITQIITISVFPMLVMSTMVEKFVGISAEKGYKAAVFLVSETVIVSVLCFFVAEWTLVKTLMLGHPEIIILLFIINIFLGRWSGLRVFEYFRFRELFRHMEE